ncbi:hypothetical protein ACE3MZ_02610 [Paenibacillus sp. WLX1005]|uniref:hypothetical protein n=1 Tax=unclassified Paenibacillus TaxID=185978 RepID=UPI00398407ED
MDIREKLDQRLLEMTDENKSEFIKQVCLVMNNRNNSDLIVRAKINELVQRFGLYD